MENPADLKTCWCLYLGCYGFGISQLGNPLCKSQQKCLCLKQSAEGGLAEIMGPDGLCLDNSKCLCFQSSQQIIPTKPFIEVAGFRLWGAAKPSGSLAVSGILRGEAIAGKAFGYAGDETVDDLQVQIAEAVRNEDFLRAHDLKLRRDAVQSSHLPPSLAMP